jgi:hypothetical protein
MTATEWFFGENVTADATLEGREYEAEVYVRCDDPQDTGKTVIDYLVSEGFDYGSKFMAGNDQDNATRIYQLDRATRVDGSCELWRTTIRYKLITAGSRESDESGNPASTPLEFRPELSIRTQIRQVPVDKATYLGGYVDDVVGIDEGEEYPIVNSAWMEFIPQPKRDESSKIVRIKRNLAAVSFTEDNFPTDWINDREVTFSDRKTSITAEPYKAKFLRWSTEPRFQEGIDFVEVALEIEIRKKEWRKEYLDQGLMGTAQYGGQQSTLIPDGRGGNLPNPPQNGAAPFQKLVDATGNTVSSPVPFNGRGRPKENYADFVYSKWGLYDEIDPTEIPFLTGLADD